MNHDPKAGPAHLQASAVVTHRESKCMSGGYLDSSIRDRLTRMLASTLTAEALTVTKRDYDTLYQLDVYVVTSEQLSRLIEQRAEAISQGRPVRLELMFPRIGD